MESDQEDNKSSKSMASQKVEKEHNISHEDLSDVSDIDSDGPDETEKETKVICLLNISYILILFINKSIVSKCNICARNFMTCIFITEKT